MKFNFSKEENIIEVGDVVMSSKNKYYLITREDISHYPIKIISLSDGIHANGFKSLKDLNEFMYIHSGSETIIEIIKNKDVELRRVDG